MDITEAQNEPPHTHADNSSSTYVPYLRPPSDAPTKEIVNLSFSDPFSWLASWHAYKGSVRWLV